MEPVKLSLECKSDWTVEEVIIEVMKCTDIPLTALPFMTLATTKKRKTIHYQNKTFLKPICGLPFFEKFRLASKCQQDFYLLVNISFLPECDMCKQLLGQRGLAMVIHQVLSDLAVSPPTTPLVGQQSDDKGFQERNLAIAAGLAYLSSEESPCTPDRPENEKTELLTEDKGKLSQSRHSYCENFHKHVFGSMAPVRALLGKEQSFIDGMVDTVEKYKSRPNGNLTLFWDQINELNSEPHPLFMISSALVSSRESSFLIYVYLRGNEGAGEHY